MLPWIKNFINIHPEAAPFAIALSLMLAGLNIPISADVVILLAASLAATVLKGYFFHLYIAIVIGSCVAAYLAYFQGRFLGKVFMKKKFFQKLFPQDRIIKIKQHYARHSWATLIIGRFIPFGFRNALFVSTGLTKIPFKEIVIKDFVACLLWSMTIYCTFYQLVLKVDDLMSVIKKFNLIIFLILGLSIIAAVWYKQIKRRRLSTSR